MKTVTAAILQMDGKILIAKRKKGDALENKWEFPGGKIEPGETPEQCLVRELTGQFYLHDHQEIRWITPEELGLYDFAEADRPIVQQLKARFACSAGLTVKDTNQYRD